jgi:hypothetical protein
MTTLNSSELVRMFTRNLLSDLLEKKKTKKMKDHPPTSRAFKLLITSFVNSKVMSLTIKVATSTSTDTYLKRKRKKVLAKLILRRKPLQQRKVLKTLLLKMLSLPTAVDGLTLLL